MEIDHALQASISPKHNQVVAGHEVAPTSYSGVDPVPTSKFAQKRVKSKSQKSRGSVMKPGMICALDVETSSAHGADRLVEVLHTEPLLGDGFDRRIVPVGSKACYVHFLGCDNAEDDWVLESDLKLQTDLAGLEKTVNQLIAEGKAEPSLTEGQQLILGAPLSTKTPKQAVQVSVPIPNEPLSGKTRRQHEHIKRIRGLDFGPNRGVEIRSWYPSPYPKELLPLDFPPYVPMCHRCLGILPSQAESEAHNCVVPGDVVYEDASSGIELRRVEVSDTDPSLGVKSAADQKPGDCHKNGVNQKNGSHHPHYSSIELSPKGQAHSGRASSGEYCCNLVLLSKLFLADKRAAHDKELQLAQIRQFVFYVLYKGVGSEKAFVGYFSKYKVARKESTPLLSCIMVLPHWQKIGVGQFLIAASYAIADLEDRTCKGSAERPISSKGLKAFTKFWAARIVDAIRSDRSICDGDSISLRSLSAKAKLTAEDTWFVVSKAQNLLSASKSISNTNSSGSSKGEGSSRPDKRGRDEESSLAGGASGKKTGGKAQPTVGVDVKLRDSAKNLKIKLDWALFEALLVLARDRSLSKSSSEGASKSSTEGVSSSLCFYPELLTRH